MQQAIVSLLTKRFSSLVLEACAFADTVYQKLSSPACVTMFWCGAIAVRNDSLSLSRFAGVLICRRMEARGRVPGIPAPDSDKKDCQSAACRSTRNYQPTHDNQKLQPEKVPQLITKTWFVARGAANTRVAMRTPPADLDWGKRYVIALYSHESCDPSAR